MINFKFNINLNHYEIFSKCKKMITHHVRSSIEQVYNGISNFNDFSNKTHNQPHNWTELSPLIEEIYNRIEYTTISGSWFLLSSKGHYIKEHYHPNAKKYVVTYYPSVNKNHSKLYFYDSIKNSWKYYDIVVGDVIVFDKYVLHKTEPQQIEEIRCCITINF